MQRNFSGPSRRKSCGALAPFLPIQCPPPAIFPVLLEATRSLRGGSTRREYLNAEIMSKPLPPHDLRLNGKTGGRMI
jgi:hypothetical protein